MKMGKNKLQKIMYRKVLCLFIVLGICSHDLFAQNLTPAELRTWYTNNPIGLDEPNPGLSWILKSDQRGAHQTAYRILVASEIEKLSEEKADIWDSGIVESDEQVQILYEGPELISAKRYYWTVSVWDSENRQSKYADPVYFETGLMNRDDWKAVWISDVPAYSAVPKHEDILQPRPAPHFRKSFHVETQIASARLFISGLGYYEAFINGERVGDHLLDPMKTRYDRKVLYVTYDVTDYLIQGKNAIGVILGTGWYNFHALAAWDFHNAPWRAPASLKAQLEITYNDGSSQTIRTDRTWQMNTGPIVFDSVHNGETYDARLELGGWTNPSAETDDWQQAFEVLGPDGEMRSQQMPPIRHVRTLSAQEISNPKPNILVYDFGENITGWIHLVANGPEGMEIVIRHGERLYDDGTLDYEELSRFVFSGETQTSRYILGPDQPSGWSPRFTYHGFQYAQVEVADGVEIISLEARVVHTDFEKTGSFASSNPLFSKIHEAKKLAYLGNYHGYPTDCPHREKIGWSGDAHLVAEGGLFNYETVSAYIKWIDDFVDEQRSTGQVAPIIPTSGWGYDMGMREEYIRNRGRGPQWEGAFVLIPWYLYLHTGDTSIIERYYESLRKYVRYLERHAEENYTLSFGIDDHKTLTDSTPPILATGYFYSFANILNRMAEKTGRESDMNYFSELARKIKQGYRERFYDQENQTWGNGSQTSLAGTLYHDLAGPDDVVLIIEKLLNNLEERDFHLDTGVIGTKYMLRVLTEYGHADVMYRIASKTTFPSWGYWIEKGATTLWQNWDGTQSRNHVMFGSIDEWFYKAIAGIRPDPGKPGFRRVIIYPEFIDDLEWAKGSYDSWRGTIRSEWEKTDREIRLNVEIPANTSAYVYLPDSDPKKMYESGRNIEDIPEITIIGSNGNRFLVEIKSGIYHFSIGLD
jgi:alpha-L-rhamnosidase